MSTIERQHIPTRRILRLPEVLHLTGMSRSSLYLRISEGKFPAQTPLGGRSVGWDSLAVERWIKEQFNDL